MANDFDIIDAAKDSMEGMKKTFGKKAPWIIGGGIILAVGAGIYSLLRSSDEVYQAADIGTGYPGDMGNVGISDPGLPAGAGGTSADMSSFFQDLINMQMDTSDLIYSQAAQLDRLTERIDRLSTEESTVYLRDELPEVSHNLYLVNQGVEGRRVLESADSIEARQKERYDRAAASGNTKYMDIVKKETESATGRKVNWDSGSNNKSSSSSTTTTYIEGGIKYENINGKIYKDGRLIPEKDYKYIPKQVGGTRG